MSWSTLNSLSCQVRGLMHMGHSANMTTVGIISWMVDGFSFLFPGRSTGGIWEWMKEDQHGNYGNTGWLPKAICQRFRASEYSLCNWLQHIKYPGSSEEVGLEHHALLSKWELSSLFADKGLLSLWHCLGQPDQPPSISYAQHYNKDLINFDTTRERFLPGFCSSGNLSSFGCR
jgi:hypothetical protein